MRSSRIRTATASSSSRSAPPADPHGWLLRWLDCVPLVPLALAAAILALSPPGAEPHLWRKLVLLATGRLVQPLDIVDFFLHASLPLVLGMKLLRLRARPRR